MLAGTIFQDVAVSWQAANAAPAAPPAGAAATQEAQYTDARRRMEEAMFKVVEKRTQQDGRSEED